MKTFLVLYSEKQVHILNDDLLSTHIEFLKKLNMDDRLSICGPFIDNKGAVLIIMADTIMEAEEIIKQDPFIRQNYYKKYVIHEFMVANSDNNWLTDVKQTKDNL